MALLMCKLLIANQMETKMNAFTQAFGPKAQAKSVIEGTPEKKQPSDDIAMRMIKMLMPDFDPTIITKLGVQVETMVAHFNTELATIKSNQEKILAILERTQNDGR